MKVLLTIFISLICFVATAQTPYPTPPQTQGAPTTATKDKGARFVDSTFVQPRYSDTIKANRSKTSLYPGSRISVGNDEYYRSEDTTRWILVATTNSNCGGTRLINGSITWSSVAYIFNATELDYGIICGIYHSDTATLTVSPSDPTYPRIDVFYADTSGQVGIIQGIPSPTPVKPSVDALSQIEVSFVYVPAGSVTPPQVATIIYNENIEWATASNISGINFAYPTNPYDGLVSTLVPLMTAPFDFLSYQNGSVLNINNYQYLKLYLRRNSALGSDPPSELIFTFYNGATQVTSSIFLADGSYGYDGSVIGSYQLIVIPISAFTLADSLFDKLYITNTFGSLSSFQLDKIYLLGNVPPPPVISNSWNINGNASTNPALNYVGTSDSTQLNIGRNGNFDLIIPDDGINLTADTSKHILVRDPITNKLYWIYQPSIYALGCLKIYDSTSTGITRKYIRDTCASGGGGSGWLLNGNAITSGDFLGTTNNEDLVLKRNNVLAGRISLNEENTYFGESAGLGVTTGVGNSLFGTGAGTSIDDGSYNTLSGGFAGQAITNGEYNSVFGYGGGGVINGGKRNTLYGAQADVANASTDSSGAFGMQAIATTRQMAFSPYFKEFKATGIPTGVGYVLTDLAGDGILTLQPASGGGSSLFPTTGTGTATGNVTGDLNGNTLSVMNGNVGIGTSTPTVALDVVGDATISGAIVVLGGGFVTGNLEINNGTDAVIKGNPSTFRFEAGDISGVDNGYRYIIDQTDGHLLDGAVRMSTYGAGAATFDASGNITSVSDERLKNISGKYLYGLNAIKKINPIIYKWNGIGKEKHETNFSYAGFSAQNVKSALPLSTGTNIDGYLSLQDRAIMAALVNAVKELSAKVDAQAKEIKKLKQKK